MTEQNVKNLSILSNYIENAWGLRKQDVDFLKERIFNPFIPPEFKNLEFDENFRCSFDLNPEMSPETFIETDRGWRYFRGYFCNAYQRLGISYREYLLNKKVVNKNEVKIKKILQDYYKNNLSEFRSDFVRESLGEHFSAKSRSSLTVSDIEPYIIKAFEVIGVYKPKANNMKLVISFNYADWLLCSYGEDWTSCLNIEGGGYWKGWPTLLGDNNRGFMYVTSEGKSKEWQGIKVDSFMARSWIILSENSKKVISRFYPTSPLSIEAIKQITNDKSFCYSNEISSSLKGKYELRPICLKKDNLYFTIYNDIVSIDEYYFREQKKLRYNFGNKGGRQFFNFSCGDGSVKSKEDKFSSLSSFMNNKTTIGSEFRAYTCSKCHSTHNIINIKDDAFCEDCLDGEYEKCEYCGEYHLKNEMDFITITGVKTCKSCFERHVTKCQICGEFEFKNNMRTIIFNGKEVSYCISCQKTKEVTCKSCGQKVIKGSKEDLHFKGEHYCASCIKEDEILSKLKVCSICNELLEEKDAIIDYFENAYCDSCLQKERDKKQKFFEF